MNTPDIETAYRDLSADNTPQKIEVSKAIRRIRNIKLAGSNSILAETLKLYIKPTIKILRVLFREIYEGKQVPTDW